MNLLKINYKKSEANDLIKERLIELIRDEHSGMFNIRKKDIVFVCIGTDRVIGDSYGPYIGTLLKERISIHKGVYVYGTLDSPIHALNINESFETIFKRHKSSNSIFISIDACLGSKSSIGNINIRKAPVKPGKGVGKNLPSIGDYSIVGIVDKVDFDNKFSFNNIKLSLIRDMVKTSSLGIIGAIDELRDIDYKREVAVANV